MNLRCISETKDFSKAKTQISVTFLEIFPLTSVTFPWVLWSTTLPLQSGLHIYISLTSICHYVCNYLLTGKSDIYCHKVSSFFKSFHHNQEFEFWTTILCQDVEAIHRHWIVKLNSIEGCDHILGDWTMSWKK